MSEEVIAALREMVSIFEYSDKSGVWFDGPKNDDGTHWAGCGWCFEYQADDDVVPKVLRARELLARLEAPPCSSCGSITTVDLHDVDPEGREQSITICAECGSDEG